MEFGYNKLDELTREELLELKMLVRENLGDADRRDQEIETLNRVVRYLTNQVEILRKRVTALEREVYEGDETDSLQ